MIGNFTFCSPTRLHFGDRSMSRLPEELIKYGPKVMLTYGGGSIKRNGVYEEVLAALEATGKVVVEDPGVMSNPTVEKLYNGARIAREHDVDLILAVGGGSVIDYAKGVSASAWCDEDPWEKYYLRKEMPECRLIPVGCVLTMVGTGSEMNGGSVITNHAQKIKTEMGLDDRGVPKFAILNPRYTLSVPKYQMVSGIYDIFNHICEQYFSGDDDNVSDYLSEGLMRSVIHASRIAVRDPLDYEARSNLMWASTWALNTLIAKGKTEDWEVHMIGQAIGAFTDAAHGMTLSAVSLPYYRRILPYGLHRFVRFARNVWDIPVEGMDPESAALAGLSALEEWMNEIGVVMHAAELGVTKEMTGEIAAVTPLYDTGYRKLTKEDVEEILRESL